MHTNFPGFFWSCNSIPCTVCILAQQVVRAKAVSVVLFSVFYLLLVIQVKFDRGEEGLLLFSKMIREALFMLFSGADTLVSRSL